MSLSGPPDELVAKYIAQAVDQSRLIVAGAGNGGALAKPAFPAALPGVLAVTAVNNRNHLYEQANRGDYIDVAAPGVDIVTLAADGSFPVSSGTSWAAAHVSGVAALLHPLMPLSSPAEIAFLLRGHGADLGVTGKDSSFGYGLIDVCAAAAAATANAFTCPSEEVSSNGF
jgi:subtilisin family serine protease